MERFRQDSGARHHRLALLESHGGKSRDEHHAQVGLSGTSASRQLDSIDTRHHDVGDQQIVTLVESFKGLTPVAVAALLEVSPLAPAWYVVATCGIGLVLGVYMYVTRFGRDSG